MKTRYLITAALLFLAVSAGAATPPEDTTGHPEGDCCWGPGCSLTKPIHAIETELHPIGCTNIEPGGTGTIGRCRNEYIGPSWNNLICDVAGCSTTGQFRCAGPGYPVHPPFYLNCPGKTVGGVAEMPAVVTTQTYAICEYTDGSGYISQCNSAGGTTTSPL